MTILQAVNEILEAVGMTRVSTYTQEDASWAAQAHRRIDKASMDFQADGYTVNVREKVSLSPILFEFSNAAWTAATNTLTLASTFGNATVGMTIRITDANGGAEDDYVVSEVTSVDAVKFSTSLNGTDIASGIDGEAITNQIKVPTGTLRIDSDGTDAYRDIVQLGDHLFNRDDTGDGTGGTDQFEDSVVTVHALRYDFECLPYDIQQYIVARATVEFYDRWTGTKSPLVYQRLLDRERNAKVRADQYRSSTMDVNILNAPHNRGIAGSDRVRADWAGSVIARTTGWSQ